MKIEMQKFQLSFHLVLAVVKLLVVFFGQSFFSFCGVFEQVHNLDLTIIISHGFEMFSKSFLCHFARSGQNHVFEKLRCAFALLRPEDRNTTSTYYETVLEIFDFDDLLSFRKIRDISFIVDSSCIESGSSSCFLPTCDHRDFQIHVSKSLLNVPNMPLNDRCVPFDRYVVFLKCLINISVPKVSRITGKKLYRARLVKHIFILPVKSHSALSRSSQVVSFGEVKAVFQILCQFQNKG